MLARIPGLPDNTIGVTASGQVDARDYETILVPAVEKILKSHRKARVLYELGSDFTGFTPGAMWDDMKLGLGHFASWEKAAVVTDIPWIAHAMNLFGFVLACPVKVFPLKDAAEARKWIVA
jgi:SpoIIAA-like